LLSDDPKLPQTCRRPFERTSKWGASLLRTVTPQRFSVRPTTDTVGGAKYFFVHSTPPHDYKQLKIAPPLT
jgi:hypothetical protein